MRIRYLVPKRRWEPETRNTKIPCYNLTKENCMIS